MASKSATSTTSSERPVPMRSFATLRFAGDSLIPEKVTHTLRFKPTLSYAKGERYSAGPRSAELTGRTGVWFLSTDRFLASPSLSEHLAWLRLIVLLDPAKLADDPSKFLKVMEMVQRDGLQVVVTCFWHGPPGA